MKQNYLKSFCARCLTLLVLALLSTNLAWGDYVKVTSSADLTDGTYLVVCESQNVAFNGALTTLDATSNTVAVTITDGKISSSDAVDAAAFTFTASNGSFLGTGEKYFGNASNSNGLTSSATALTNTVSISNGNADIVSSGGAYLRYNKNSDQTRFRYYKSSSYTNQQAIQLYKKQESTKTLTSIAIKTAPTTVSYAAGEFFSPAGLVITATYDDASTADIAYEGNEDKFSFSPALDAALATTDEKVTITYGSQTCNQTITVKNIELTSIVVSGDLATTEYTEGDDFDFTGLVATGYYSDESNKTITDQVDWSIDPATLTAGQTSVSVIATSGLISGNKSYNITVAAAPQVIDNWNTLFGTSYNGQISGLQGTNDLVLQGTTAFGVTVKVENHASKNGYVKNQDLRMYTMSDGDYTFTVTAPTGKIFKEIVATKADKAIAVKEQDGKGSISVDATSGAMTWTGKANSLVFVPTATTGFGTMSFVIAEPTPSAETPTITPSVEAETYFDAITVTLASEGADAIYFTTDESVPTAASALYENPIAVSATTTIKAIAVKDGLENSEVASKTFTFGPIYSSISDLVKAGEPTGTGHTVKVTFSNIVTGFYTTGAGNRNGVYVNVKDTKDDFVEIYCAGVDKDWAVGGMVEGTLKCTWKRYSGTWELCPKNWNDVTYTAPAVTNVTVSTYGWATYYVPFDATVSGDATAYYVTTTDGNLSKTLITESEHIVAGTGVLLKGQEGEEKTATFTPVELDEEKVANEWYDNQLQGTNVVGGETFTGDNKTWYILTLGSDNKVGFYWDPETNNEGASATCPAGKAVLAVPESSGAKAFFSLDGEPTGIKTMDNGQLTIDNSKAYNLNGVRVNENYKGIIIVNGKKYINK